MWPDGVQVRLYKSWAVCLELTFMDDITLHRVLPAVFLGREPEASDVWLSELSFHRGESCLLVASSGAGKSSLCSYLMGVRTDYAGRIEFDGNDISRYDAEQWCTVRKLNIAYLPQDMRLFTEMTVLENIELKNRLTGYRTRSEIEGFLEELGVGDKRDALASTLSLGQQQRVAVVRTLCQPCDFMLLDEPVSHLDDDNNFAVAAMIGREAARQGAAVIVTSVGNNLKLDYDKRLRL